MTAYTPALIRSHGFSVDVSYAVIDMFGAANVMAATTRDNGTCPGSQSTNQITAALKAAPRAGDSA